MKSPPTNTSKPFLRVFIIEGLQFPVHSLVTMSHEDLPKYIIFVVHGSDNPCATASRYSVKDKKIIGIAIKLESVQDEQ